MSKKEISIHLSNTKRQDTKACCSKTNIKKNDTSIYIITYTCIIVYAKTQIHNLVSMYLKHRLRYDIFIHLSVESNRLNWNNSHIHIITLYTQIDTFIKEIEIHLEIFHEYT